MLLRTEKLEIFVLSIAFLRLTLKIPKEGLPSKPNLSGWNPGLFYIQIMAV